MEIPKYKKTKWKVPYCPKCKKIGNRDWLCNREHNIVERDNIPFFLSEVKIESISWKGWANARDTKLGVKFQIAPSDLEQIILIHGVKPGGIIEDRWWICSKKGDSISCKIMSED